MLHEIKKFIEHKAYNMRLSSILMTTTAGSGHPTSALSAADLVAALFFYGMRFDPKNPKNPENDRFILSKGHAAPILYAVYKELGVVSEQDLMAYRTFGAELEGHPTRRFAYTEAATGSLGMGLSIGAGMALSARMDNRAFKTFVLLGDSEIAEGSVWEAAEIAAHYKLDNLIAIIDGNRLGQSTQTLHGHHLQRYAEKFHAFGWRTLTIDGHDVQQIMSALDKAQEPHTHAQPTVIIAKTIKGYGVPSAADHEGFHGKAFSKQEFHDIVANIDAQFAAAAHYQPGSFIWQPKLPEAVLSPEVVEKITLKLPTYKIGEQVATRQAYGHALVAAGVANKQVVSLDAEVKNSTFAELFEEKYPERFVQCFIAEQNMVSMGVGLEARGKLPFISTFGCFLTRAHDQIRMAAVSNAALRICGSHAGVSIGQDGPSQMALEDIAMMRALPGSVVVYPSDAVSTHKLVEQMANYRDGISYLRTTRGQTPVLYDNTQEFPLGGLKILRESAQDVACVVGAGITVHEALKAYEILQAQGISVAVIDLYSIKPIDTATLLRVVTAAGKHVITVEDHYLDGGLGQAVAFALRNSGCRVESLAVTQLPRSGKPEELLAWAGIDAAAIARAVIKT